VHGRAKHALDTLVVEARGLNTGQDQIYIYQMLSRFAVRTLVVTACVGPANYVPLCVENGVEELVLPAVNFAVADPPVPRGLHVLVGQLATERADELTTEFKFP